MRGSTRTVRLTVPRRLYNCVLWGYDVPTQALIWRRRWLMHLRDLVTLVAFVSLLLSLVVIASAGSLVRPVEPTEWLGFAGFVVLLFGTAVIFGWRSNRFTRAKRRLERMSGLDWDRIDTELFRIQRQVQRGDPNAEVSVKIPEDAF